MKLIPLIAALVFAQPTKTFNQEPEARTANLQFTVDDISGKRVALNSYRGDVILLDFWATWCAPCRKQIPGFIDLYKRYKSRGVVVLGVSVDESPGAVKKFVKELRVNYPILLGGGRDDLQQAFGPIGFPTLYIIDRDGQIRSQQMGLTSIEEVERTINLLL
ncbi:MAG TPA: TlpA disulfide reductase family protein [Terriglobia bacterium]|nr:TlpA disulfide reductase family protein [Terriglobia bacterium]